MNYSNEFEMLAKEYSKAGEDDKVLFDRRFGSLVINNNKVVGKNEIDGFCVKYKTIKDGVDVKVYIKKNTNIENPIHLCFGMLPKEGKQIIKSKFFIGKNSKVKFIAHCLFPNAVHIEHIMDSEVYISENAEMLYLEEHFHGNTGGAAVYPKLKAKIEKNGRLFEEFKITKGRIGILDIDYEVEQKEKSSCKLLMKAYGKKNDKIKINETLHLNEDFASGIAKSNIVLTDNSIGEVLGMVEGNAKYTRGHIECHEIINGKNAKASSLPKISVNHPLAKITHEASIGRIDKKKLETLMSRGLTEKEAIDFIVNGLLK